MLNVSRAFTFMFEDKNWAIKLSIGALIFLGSLVVIGLPFLLGYLLEVARRSSLKNDLPLPAWDNLGELFARGIIFLIILIIWALPGFVGILPCVGRCLMLLYFFFLSWILPLVTFKFAQTGNFADAFHLPFVFNFARDNFSNLLLVWFLTILLMFLALFGILVFLIGVCFTFFWALLAIYHLYGQLCAVGIVPPARTLSSTTP